MKKLKILFTGEPIDDHIFVIKEIIKEMDKIIEKEENIEFEASYTSSSTKNFKIKIKTGRDVRVKTILPSIFLFPLSFIQSFFYLFINTPDLIFTKGGQISIPIIISAQILRIPIFLHTTNSSLLPINQFVAKNALIIFTSFNDTKGLEKRKEMRLGYPVDQEPLDNYLLNQEDFSISRKEKRPTLFFISKFKNSEKINDFILNILNELVQKFYIFHETTKEKYDQIKKESEIVLGDSDNKNFYHIFYSSGYPDKLKKVQTMSDIIISEFNEKIMFQISSLQKPSILIIFSDKINDIRERRKIENAYFYANIGAGIVFEEANLKKGLFLDKLNNLFEDPDIKELKKMREKAKEFSTPNAGKLIATYLFEYWKFKVQ